MAYKVGTWGDPSHIPSHVSNSWENLLQVDHNLLPSDTVDASEIHEIPFPTTVWMYETI